MTKLGPYPISLASAVILSFVTLVEARFPQTVVKTMTPRLTVIAVFGSDDDDSLRKAAKRGDLPKIEALLRSGTNVDTADKKGRTALIDAAAKGQTEAVKLLLQHGAKPNTQDKEGFTSLRAASVEGHLEIIRALLDAGADVNFRHKEALTALMVAATKGHTDAVRLLVSRGADLKAKSDFLGFDALCYASLEREAGTFRWSRWKQGMPKYPETIQALLDAGASPSTCFIYPDYLKNAPGSFAILLFEVVRTYENLGYAAELPN